MWRFIVASMVIIPLWISLAGKDPFRLPKDVLFRGAGLTVAGGVALFWILGRARVAWSRSVFVILPWACVIWALVATIFSQRPLESLYSFSTVLAGAVLFSTERSLLRGRTVAATWAVLAPAVINSVLFLLQKANLWRPFQMDPGSFGGYGGLLGNSTDVGTFLVAPILAAAALTFCLTGWHRVVTAAIGLLLFGALVVSMTLTAIIALFAGLGVLSLLLSWRQSVIALLVTLSLATGVMLTESPLRERILQRVELARQGQYNVILTGRMSAYFAALEIWRDHPLTGAGPGTFHTFFFDYKIRADERYPVLTAWPETIGWPINFGEAHNDHLQLLAEGGLPAYVLFLCALGAFGALTFRGKKTTVDSPERRFARLLSFPLAVSLFVLALAQFPLQLAATTAALLYLMACCCAWSTDAL